MALPKQNRLTAQNQIVKNLFRTGIRKSASFFTLIYLLNPNISFFRATVVVSKKIEKRAVFRNLIKRKFHITLLVLNKKYKIKPSDLVILPNKGVLSATQEKIEDELFLLLGKEKILNNV